MTDAPKHKLSPRVTCATCATCVWWNRARRASWTDYDGARSYIVEHAQCRRYAPGAKRGEPMSREWPEVNANDWCGEHSAITGRAALAEAERDG